MRRREGHALPLVSLCMCWPNMLGPVAPSANGGPSTAAALLPQQPWCWAAHTAGPRRLLASATAHTHLVCLISHCAFTVFSPSKAAFLLPFLLYSQLFFLLFLYCLLLFLLHPWLRSLAIFSLYTCRYSAFTLILCFSSVFCHTRKETNHIKVCVFLSFHTTKPAPHRGL